MWTDETEAEFFTRYDSSVYKKPNASVDVVIFTVREGQLHFLTIQRAEHPFQGAWSLVGGFVNPQEDVDLEATAKRKLHEKTGVQTPYLEQFCTIGNAIRDPRGWSLTIVYFALIPSHDVHLNAGKGAQDIKWTPINDTLRVQTLAFDHAEIVQICVQRLRNKVLYTSLPVHLMPNDFTLGELQKVYEIILGQKLDHKSFRRRILNANILEETGSQRHDQHRPAMLYRSKNVQHTHYFVRNIEGAYF